MTLADSGATFLIDGTAAVATTIPAAAVGNRGVTYRFVLSVNAGAAGITVASGAADMIGTNTDATPTVDQLTGITTMTCANGVALIGDNLEVYSTGSRWLVRSVSSAANGFTWA